MYLIAEIRRSKGRSLEEVAEAVGTNKSNLAKIEKGRQLPKRDLARALFQYYGGAVPLVAIYDPEAHEKGHVGS